MPRGDDRKGALTLVGLDGWKGRPTKVSAPPEGNRLRYEFDAETRFRAIAANGSAAAGLALLDKLAAAFVDPPGG